MTWKRASSSWALLIGTLPGAGLQSLTLGIYESMIDMSIAARTFPTQPKHNSKKRSKLKWESQEQIKKATNALLLS